MIAPVGGGELAQASALSGWNRIELGLPLLTASQHPGFMEVALGAAASGLATFAAQQVEGAWREGLLELELTQQPAQGGIGLPEFFAALRQVGAQSVLHITLHDTEHKGKM